MGKRKHEDKAVRGGAAAAAAAPAAAAGAGSNWAALSKNIGAGKRPIVLGRKTNPKDGAVAPTSTTAATPSTSAADGNALTNVVALDCEMVGVGAEGRRSALARVTVVNMHGSTLYDTHVAVKEAVTDYRTFVSGVHWYDLKGAPSFESVQAQVAAILRGRILVGHTLKSDMTALLLSHPAKDTRDLALYAPLQRSGADGVGGARKGLRVLAAEVLGLEIQTGEHSPVEDARASMYVYLRYRKQWEKELRGGKVHAGQRAKRAKHMRSAP